MAGRRGGDDFDPPEYHEGAREGLIARMSDALKGNRETGSVGFLVNLFGGRGRGGGTGKLADEIVRETGENRKSVMKRIQRALKGEGNPKNVDKGTGVVDKQLRGNAAAVMRAAPSVNASVRASITVSSETYPTQRTARAHLTGAKAEAFAAAIEAGAYEEAVNIVFAAYWGDEPSSVEIHEFGEIQF